MTKSKIPIHSRRRFIGTFSAMVSAGAWLFGPGEARAVKGQIKDVLNEIETDALIRSTPRRTEGFYCRIEDDNAFLIDKRNPKPGFRLNRTGRFVWKRCDGTNNPYDLSKMMSRFYNVDPHQAYVDCLYFISTLKAKGAICV
jgi:coenzyme PQQ synthesis protein D (PqqD)